MKRYVNLALALAASVALGACGNHNKNAVSANNAAPEWVNKGSGAFKDASGAKAIYGVGILQGVRNVGLAIPAVDDRGRAEITKIMNSYVTVLGKDYASSVTAGDPSKSSEEQMVTQTHKVFAQIQLHGATPVDHWVDRSDPQAPVYYSLVKLDMASVMGALTESTDLDAKTRDYVKANADKAFDELNGEQAKH
ncbi:MAG: hypothetical protein ACHQ49_16945 [Elusimicrobiota bacterium]